MYFQEFCNMVASTGRIDDDLNVDESVVTDDMKRRMKALCSIMSTKIDIADRIEIPYIESAFQNLGKAETALQSYNDGDVPDYLLKEFSTNLYHQELKELTDEQQNIIKTLAAYICISIQSSNN